MPTKLKILVSLMGLSIVLNLATQAWLALVVNVGLLIGVIKGNEAVRTLLITFAWLGLAFSAFVLIVGAISVSVLVSGGNLAEGAIVAVVTTFMGAFGAGQNVYFLWCLRQPDVQQWMFRRSLGMAGEDTD